MSTPLHTEVHLNRPSVEHYVDIRKVFRDRRQSIANDYVGVTWLRLADPDEPPSRRMFAHLFIRGLSRANVTYGLLRIALEGILQ